VGVLEELLFIKDVPTSADKFFTKQGLIAVDKARILEQYRLESANQQQLGTVVADARQASIVSNTVKLEPDGSTFLDKLELTSELPTNAVKLLGDHDAYLDYVTLLSYFPGYPVMSEEVFNRLI
jgi:hypothetical protein